MSERDAALHADTLNGLLHWARRVASHLESGAIQFVSIRTRMRTEYLLSPDEDSGSGCTVCIVQGPEDASARIRYAPVTAMSDSAHDWLFGVCDE